MITFNLEQKVIVQANFAEMANNSKVIHFVSQTCITILSRNAKISCMSEF